MAASDRCGVEADRPTDWADLKRLSASVWVWARFTGGEQRLAPAFRPAPMRGAPTSLVGATKSPRYHLDRRDYGHYAALRRRLTDYADTLAATVDARTMANARHTRSIAFDPCDI